MKSKKLKRKQKKFQYLWTTLFVFLAIPLTVFLAINRHDIRTSAQTLIQGPPLFFCLTMGESNTDACTTQVFKGDDKFFINGFPYERNKSAYYNDTIMGETTYKNTGDKAITLKSIGFYAQSRREEKRVAFEPTLKNITLKPGQEFTFKTGFRRFAYPDAAGVWEVFSSATTASGQQLDNPKKTIINLSSACTALRAIPLSKDDISNLKKHCAKNTKSTLCTSRQYCELVKGEGCTQKSPNQPHLDKKLQCDRNIVIPQEEEAFLNEFCKAYPKAHTCQNICNRALDTPLSLCPDPETVDENVEGYTSTGAQQAVAGISTLALGNTNCRPGQTKNRNTGECCKYNGPLLSTGQCPRAPGGGGSSGGGSGGGGGSCSSRGGSCMNPASCRGTVLNGLCPGGNNNKCCVSGGGGGGGSGGGGGGRRVCASNNFNKVGDCCLRKGPLTPQGRCPRAGGAGGGGGSGGGSRYVSGGGGTSRACAPPARRNASGLCVDNSRADNNSCDVNRGSASCGNREECRSAGGSRSGNCTFCQDRFGGCQSNTECCGGLTCQHMDSLYGIKQCK